MWTPCLYRGINYMLYNFEKYGKNLILSNSNTLTNDDLNLINYHMNNNKINKYDVPSNLDATKKLLDIILNKSK